MKSIHLGNFIFAAIIHFQTFSCNFSPAVMASALPTPTPSLYTSSPHAHLPVQDVKAKCYLLSSGAQDLGQLFTAFHGEVADSWIKSRVVIDTISYFLANVSQIYYHVIIIQFIYLVSCFSYSLF